MPSPSSWDKDSAAARFLKKKYPDGWTRLTYPKGKFHAWLKKDTSWEGDTWNENPLFGGETATSEFAAALQMQSNPVHERFEFTPGDGALVSSIQNKLLAFAKTKKGSVEKALDTKLTAMFYGWGRMNARNAYGNGGGSIGVVGSIATTTVANDTIVLSDKYKASFFEKGMPLQFGVGDGTTSGDTVKAGSAVVDKVQRAQGRIIFSGDVTSLANAAVNDNIFVYGQHGQGAEKPPVGMAGHIPLPGVTISASDSHFGCNRSQDEDRLAGHRYDDKAGRDIETVLFGMAGHMETMGGSAKSCWLHTDRWSDLTNSLHSKTSYNKVTRQTDEKFGIEGFELIGPDGSIDVFTDRDMYHAYAMFVNHDAVCFASAGPWPHFDTQGGDKLLVQGQGNGKQIRMIGWGQYIMKRPVDCGWATL